MGGPVRPAPAQFQHGLAIGRQLQPILADRRTQGIAAQPFQAITRTRRYDNARMEIEPMLARVPPAEGWRVRYVDGVAPSAHRYARARAEGRDAAHGGGGHAARKRKCRGSREVKPSVAKSINSKQV